MKKGDIRLWWVIASEPNGRMDYFKSEFVSEIKALEEIARLQKEEPRYRYHLILIKPQGE